MRTPGSLLIVSWWLRIEGFLAALRMVSALAEPRLLFDFDLLGLWIGPGLLRYEARSRTWALRLQTLSVVFSAIAFLATLKSDQTPIFQLFGHSIATVSRATMLGVIAVGAATYVWQIWVLRQPSIRALFAETQGIADTVVENRDHGLSGPEPSV